MKDDKNTTTRRYTAGYQPDGSIDFAAALKRPVMGKWEIKDRVYQATFAPAGVTTGADGRLVTDGCTGFGG
jgi:hypothetical protein